jgi:uncharacterized protein (TIGR02996 family)
MSGAMREAFFRAIEAAPEDDSPRLVYADWLEEHGDDARAEFIRAQCQLARLDEGDPRRDELLRREQDLLKGHRDRWLAELPADLCLVNEYQPTFARGFPDNLEVACAAFVERSEELFRATPVQHVRIKDVGKRLPVAAADWPRVLRGLAAAPVEGVGEGVAALAACPLLAAVRGLSLDDLTPEHLATLLASPHWPALTDLRLGGRIGPGGARVIARWPGAVSLRKLSFWFAAIGPAGAEALAASPHLANLTALHLHGGFIGTPGALALANSATLRHLRNLSVGYNKIGPEGIAALLHSPNLAGVEELKISFNGPSDDGPGDAGLAALASSPTIRRLRSLDLAESRVTAEGARHLAGAAHLATLRTLDLHGNPVGPAGARHLADSPHLAGLRWLSLAQAGINDEALQALAAAPHLRPRVLLLARSALDRGGEGAAAPPTRNAVGPAGLAALAASPVLAGLEELDLSHNPVGDAGLAALAASPHAVALRKLKLTKCDLHDEGVIALARASWGTALRDLDLGMNRIGDAGGTALAGWPTLAGVRRLDVGSNQLTDVTVLALAASPHLGAVRDLELGENQITDAGGRALAAAPQLDRLTRLLLWHNRVTAAGLEPLWERFGAHVYPQRSQWRDRGG